MARRGNTDRASQLLSLSLLLRINHDGARRRDPLTYQRDAYTFYLAQSYRDCGETEKALAAYLSRAELGFWLEEVFISLYMAA